MNCSFFAGQIAELLLHLREDPVDLVGYSMGGGIAANFASQFPASIRSLVMIAPVGASHMKNIWYLKPAFQMLLRNSSIVSKISMNRIIKSLKNPKEYGKDWCKWNTSVFNQMHGILLNNIKNDTFFPEASLNIAKHFEWGDLRESFLELKKLSKNDRAGLNFPTLLINGDKDKICTLKCAIEISSLIEDCRLNIKSGRSHSLPIEHSEEVASDLMLFWQSISNFKYKLV